MKTNGGTFATAINCIDGRAQSNVRDWAIKQFGVNWVDPITEPGVVGLLAKGQVPLISEMKRKARVSAEKHGSTQLVVAGHFDCAGNPVDEDTHKEHIRRAVAEAYTWSIFIEIVGLWVNEDWEIERIL